MEGEGRHSLLAGAEAPGPTWGEESRMVGGLNNSFQLQRQLHVSHQTTHVQALSHIDLLTAGLLLW